VVKGHSSSGKNELLRCVLGLFPKNRRRFLTGVSQQALVYTGGRIEGVLVFQEAEGEETAEYVVRQVMSEGHLERITVIDGEARTLTTYVCGSVFTTTTGVSLHEENQTRVFDLHTDEGSDLTRRVINGVAKAFQGGGVSNREREHITEVWRIAMTKLQPAEVSISFAPIIGSRFPDRQVRARRDIHRVFNLVRACAILHQPNRERDEENRLLATVDDYRMVYPLIQAVLGPSMSGFTEKAMRISKLAVEIRSEEGWFNRSELQDAARTQGVASEKTVRNWAERFTDMGLWEARMEKGRRQYRVLRDPEQEPIDLPTPDELVSLVTPGSTPATREKPNKQVACEGPGKAGTGEAPPDPDTASEDSPEEAGLSRTTTTRSLEVVELQGDLLGNAPPPGGYQAGEEGGGSGREKTTI
jgi:hypothetical protein